jgi:SsrA-binding protein
LPRIKTRGTMRYMNLIENKKVGLSYEILETISAGIVLSGAEVKSLRKNHGSIGDSFVVFKDNRLVLVKAFIPPYQIKNTPPSYNPYQDRALLITKKEIERLVRKKSESGLTVVPLKLYTAGTKIKVLLGLVRGKQKHDKRETLKKRDADREIQRLLKR